MPTHRFQVVAAGFCTALMAVSACSSATRYRMLSFFFDGVPDPEAVARAKALKAQTEEGQSDEGEGADAAKKTLKVSYAHPPYRDRRCVACHDMTTGNLVASPQGGLCQSCHGGVPGNIRYVHGPVAVSDCLFCHHPHTSVIPHLLLAKPEVLCLKCHDRDDLTTGPHHVNIGEESCTNCHYGHGGANPYFLKEEAE